MQKELEKNENPDTYKHVTNSTISRSLKMLLRIFKKEFIGLTHLMKLPFLVNTMISKPLITKYLRKE